MNKAALGLFVLCGSLLLLCAFAQSSFSREERELQSRFSGWMREHKRSYESSEFVRRWNTWKANAKFVEKHNSDPKQTYKVAMNQFGDMSPQEFKRVYLGLIREEGIEDKPALNGTNPFYAEKKRSIPASFDWRTQGAVTDIKNQGQCGDCYNFATTASVEGAWQIAKGELVSLSEQHLCT